MSSLPVPVPAAPVQPGDNLTIIIRKDDGTEWIMTRGEWIEASFDREPELLGEGAGGMAVWISGPIVDVRIRLKVPVSPDEMADAVSRLR